MPSIEANGIVIEYDSFGSLDVEPMLLISGLGTQMIRWTTPFCEMLAARGFRVIRFDNRDVGLSTHFDGAPAAGVTAGEAAPYTLYDMANDVVGLLDALGIERAHIVGRSMGGMIAQLVASQHADRVLSLTSIMSTTGNPDLPPASARAFAALTRRAPNPVEDEKGFLDHCVDLARVIASPGYPFDEDAHRAQAMAELERSSYRAGFARQIAAIGASGDLRDKIRTIAVPTLVIHGADDVLVPPAGGRDTAANIRGAELRIIDGMGHDLHPDLHECLTSAIAQNARRAGAASV
jgi:pimeloyl-ACP methyl ester carboxylesterase